MSDHLVRVGNLKALQKTHGWTDSELARQCGKSPQQVRSWFVGERNIAERLARQLEERLGLARYALDDRGGTTETRDASPQTPYSVGFSVTATTRAKEVPVLAWADIEHMLDTENAALKQKAPHLESFAASSAKAKFVQMPDDSMAPEIQPGDHVLFDPTEAPRAGDVVLVKLPGGEHFVRTFRPRTAYIFAAAPVNAAYQALDSQTDGAIVVGVMVEHRRYRRHG